MSALRRAPKALALTLVLVAGLTACGAPANQDRPWPVRPLVEYLLGPVQDLPSRATDGRIVISAIYQDVQRRIDPESNLLVGDTAGWVVVALCADSPDSGRRLSELQAAIVPRDLLTAEVLERAESGSFLDALDCAPGSWSAPSGAPSDPPR